MTFLRHFTFTHLGISLSIIALLIFSELSQASQPCANAVERPCVGLVLGGGGAKGAAHVGALLAIEELGIPVDIVVGTSVGSFVSGLYATGRSADTIKQMFLTTDWNRGYQDDLPRSRIPNRRKRHDDAFPIQLGIGLDTTGFKLPKGVIQGQGMKSLIDEMLGSYPKFKSFNELHIPFRAVAADIESGEQVVLDHGDLATAMQASMSIPGVLRPIELDGRILVDGGIANNLPVSVAKDMGAQTIIAVDIGSPALTRDEITSSVEVLGQLTNFLTLANQNSARASLSANDTLIRPNLEGMGMLDFDRMPQALDSGYQAARSALATHPLASKPLNNSALADGLSPNADKSGPSTSFNTRISTQTNTSDSPLISLKRIVLNNTTRLSDKYILKRMGLLPSPEEELEQANEQMVSQAQVDAGIQKLYGQGTISRVTSFLDIVDGEQVLTLTVEEKEWGPGYLDFDLSFEDNFRSFSLFEIGAAWRYTNLSPYGAEWTNSVEFGTEKRFKTALYWPLNTSDFFLQLNAEVAREVSSYILNGTSYGELIKSFQDTQLGIGYNFSDNFDILAGVESESGRVKLPDLLQPQVNIANARYDDNAIFIRTDYDSLDNANFAREGWKFTSTMRRGKSNILSLSDYSDQVEFEASFAASFGAHTIKPTVRAGSAYARQDQLHLTGFELGGFLNLSGNDRDFISGPHMRFLRLVYTYELSKNSVGAIDLPLYLGASYEAGNIWDHQSDITWDSMISSGALFVGWDSPVGPAFFGYGRSENNQESLYISLGKGF